MNMDIQAPSGDDFPLAGDRLGRRPNHDINAGLYVRVPGLTDSSDMPVSQTYVRLDDAPMIQDQCIGDDGIDCSFGTCHL